MNDYPDSVTADAVVMQWRTWVQTQRISPVMQTDLQVMRDHMFGTLLLRLSKRVLTQKLAEDDHSVQIESPATWWQHWKQAHGRKWLGPLVMQRWPVRMTTLTGKVRVEHLMTFPTAEMYPDELGRPIRVDLLNPVRWDQ